MIQDFRSLPNRGVRGSRVAERRLELRLSRELPRKAVRYAAFDPAGDARCAAIMDAEVFDCGFMASGLKGSPDVVGDSEH